MELTRISRKYGHIPVTATLHDGEPATITAVTVALMLPGATPNAATTWLPTTYADGEAVALFVGPDADPTGAIVAESSRDLWARVVDTPEVDATKVGRITVR